MSGSDKKKQLAAAGVDNTYRRTWDKSDFEDKAKERETKEKEDEESALDIKKRKRLERDPLHQGLIVQRATLKPRDYQIDLAAKLNKTQVVSLAMPLNQQAGYFCSVCDCVLRDSQSYLDHINGKYHNRALGMSMNVERSTTEQVRSRLEEVKKIKERGCGSDEVYVADGFNKEQLEKQEAEDRKHRRKNALDSEDEEEMDPEMAAMMGFGGFGTSKK